jgi:hypothetical protein
VLHPRVTPSTPLQAALVISDRGKAWELEHNREISPWLERGGRVVLADLRGWGETRQTRKLWPHRTPHWCSRIGHEGYLAQELMQLGDSLIAARMRDLAAVMDFLAQRCGLAPSALTVCARGMAAWSAAFLAHWRRPAELRLYDFLASYAEVFLCEVPGVTPSYVIHGAYLRLDLPEVLAALAPLPLVVRRPRDGAGRALGKAETAAYVRALGAQARSAGKSAASMRRREELS